MKNDVLLKLLEDLPDDLIESAAEPEQSRRPVFLRYAIPAIAACMVIVMAAVIYPKLKTATPERTEESSFTTAVTTLQPAETQITGDAPAAVQTGTETDPYSVHIVTAPAYPAVTGKTATAVSGQTLPADDPQNPEDGGNPDDPDTPQDNDTNPQENAGTRPGARTTSPSSSVRQRTQTTAKPVTTQHVAPRTTNKPVTTRYTPRTTEGQKATDPPPHTDRANQQTQAAPVMTTEAIPNDIEGPEDKGSAQTPTGPDNPQEQRIPCRCSYEKGNGGSDNVPAPGNSNDPPVMGNEPPSAELKGNRLTVHTDRPCSKAMIAYLGLRNGKLRIEIYYDLTNRYDTGIREFTVELPWEYADQVWMIESECYEVDDIDEYDYDEEEVTLVVLP